MAALPESLRQEVIAEQFRLQRLHANSTSTAAAVQGSASSAGAPSASGSVPFAEVSPEFLAALPLNIQEEVLAQQRIEQQRAAAQNANPDAPVDTDIFFRSMPSSLRRQVLSDLDDSQLRLLPEDIATEARSLRQEVELRHRQIHERLFSTNALTRIIRSAGKLFFYVHFCN